MIHLPFIIWLVLLAIYGLSQIVLLVAIILGYDVPPSTL
jgi:hypothetical protein